MLGQNIFFCRKITQLLRKKSFIILSLQFCFSVRIHLIQQLFDYCFQKDLSAYIYWILFKKIDCLENNKFREEFFVVVVARRIGTDLSNFKNIEAILLYANMKEGVSNFSSKRLIQ